MSLINTKMDHFPISALAKIYLGGTPKRAVLEYWGGNIKWASAADIASCNSRYLRNTSESITSLGIEKSAAKVLKKDAIIITARGTVGALCMLSEPMSFNQSCYGLVCNANVDPAYLYYALTARIGYIKAQTYGAVFDTITIQSFDHITVPLPSVLVQRKISCILSAYDYLIENNMRRIKILEQMAQLIYREWFVNFRFPGYEKIRMVDSKLGKIPEGWSIQKIEDVATLFRGRSYRSENLIGNGGIPFINLKCIERNGGFRHDGIKSYKGPFNDTQIVSNGNIIVAVTDMTQERRLVAHAARIPRLSQQKAVYSMDLVKIEPKEGYGYEFLYGVFRYSNFPDVVKQHANGVNVLHLNPTHIAAFQFAVAQPNIIQEYCNIIEPIYRATDVLEEKNIILRQTRDLFLPRLISGELDVSQLDIDISNNGGSA